MNDFNWVMKQHWANWIQENLEKRLTALELAEKIDIENWTTKNLPYLKMRGTWDYVKYTDQVMSDITTGNDQIVINTTPMVNFALDDIDMEDNYINISKDVIQDGSYEIKKRIDWDFFYQVLNSKWKYDVNGFGLNTWTLTPVQLVTWENENITFTFGMAKAWLTNTWANADKLALGTDGFIRVFLTKLGLQTNWDISSDSYEKGFRWKFGWMSAYEVSTLTSSAPLALGTNPTANDTIQIQWVIFTFKSTISSQGDVLIWATLADTKTNLINAINGTWTPWTQYIELDSDDRATLDTVEAVSWTWIVNIISKNGAVMASSSLTASSDKFWIQAINCFIMEIWAIKIAIKNMLRIVNRQEAKKLVTNYFIYARYWLKVTKRSMEKMCRILIQSAPAES